jgi:hypothetical protein
MSIRPLNDNVLQPATVLEVPLTQTTQLVLVSVFAIRPYLLTSQIHTQEEVGYALIGVHRATMPIVPRVRPFV